MEVRIYGIDNKELCSFNINSNFDIWDTSVLENCSINNDRRDILEVKLIEDEGLQQRVQELKEENKKLKETNKSIIDMIDIDLDRVMFVDYQKTLKEIREKIKRGKE